MFLALICFRDAGKSSCYPMREILLHHWAQRCMVKKMAGGSDFLSWNDFCGSAAILADRRNASGQGLSAGWGKCGPSIHEACPTVSSWQASLVPSTIKHHCRHVRKTCCSVWERFSLSEAALEDASEAARELPGQGRAAHFSR